jgi:hypothetical protein
MINRHGQALSPPTLRAPNFDSGVATATSAGSRHLIGALRRSTRPPPPPPPAPACSQPRDAARERHTPGLRQELGGCSVALDVLHAFGADVVAPPVGRYISRRAPPSPSLESKPMLRVFWRVIRRFWRKAASLGPW